MAEYEKVVATKLKFKANKKKKKRKAIVLEEAQEEKDFNPELQKYDGWYEINRIDDITGSIAIEVFPKTYISCLTNGLFGLGLTHSDGDGPAPEEVFVATRVSDTKIALKTGFGKYVGIDKEGNLIGRADAIYKLEVWEPIFEDKKMALLGPNNTFLTCADEDEEIFKCKKLTAGPNEMIKFRTNYVKPAENLVPKEDLAEAKQVEITYVRKFQSFQDRKLIINQGDVDEIDDARTKGNVHEILLDRRIKMKSDKFCK